MSKDTQSEKETAELPGFITDVTEYEELITEHSLKTQNFEKTEKGLRKNKNDLSDEVKVSINQTGDEGHFSAEGKNSILQKKTKNLEDKQVVLQPIYRTFAMNHHSK